MKKLFFIVLVILSSTNIHSMFFFQQESELTQQDINEQLNQLLKEGNFANFLDQIYYNIKETTINFPKYISYLKATKNSHPLILDCYLEYAMQKKEEGIDCLKEILCLFIMVLSDIITSINLNFCTTEQGALVISFFQKKYLSFCQNTQAILYQKAEEGCAFIEKNFFKNMLEKEHYDFFTNKSRFIWVPLFKEWKSYFNYQFNISNITLNISHNMLQKPSNPNLRLINKAAYKIAATCFTLIKWSEFFNENIFTAHFIQQCSEAITSNFNYETESFNNQTLLFLGKFLPIRINEKKEETEEDDWIEI
jgi:hypothetical protein